MSYYSKDTKEFKGLAKHFASILSETSPESDLSGIILALTEYCNALNSKIIYSDLGHAKIPHSKLYLGKYSIEERLNYSKYERYTIILKKLRIRKKHKA